MEKNGNLTILFGWYWQLRFGRVFQNKWRQTNWEEGRSGQSLLPYRLQTGPVSLDFLVGVGGFFVGCGVNMAGALPEIFLSPSCSWPHSCQLPKWSERGNPMVGQRKAAVSHLKMSSLIYSLWTVGRLSESTILRETSKLILTSQWTLMDNLWRESSVTWRKTWDLSGYHI